MSDKRTTYTPKYIDTSHLEKSRTELNKEVDDEILESNSEEIIASIKEEVVKDIDEEKKEYDAFYIKKEKEISSDKEDIFPLKTQYAKKKKRLIDPEKYLVPKVPITSFNIGVAAIVVAFIFPVFGIVLGIITILSSGSDSRKRVKGIIAVIIGIVLQFIWTSARLF